MPSDRQGKQLTKNEQMLYELYMRQDEISHSLYTTTQVATAVGMLLGVDPEKIAQMLTTDREKIKEYTQKVNQAIQEVEKKKKEQETPSDLAQEIKDETK